MNKGTTERMVSMEVHDRNYLALPENLLTIGRTCGDLVNRIVIYSRSTNERMNVEHEGVHPCDFSTAVHVLTSIRERPFSSKETQEFHEKVNDVRSMMASRGVDFRRFLNEVGMSGR